MKSTKKVTIVPCKEADRRTIVEGLNTYNLQQVPAVANFWTPLEFMATDAEGRVLGGILAGIGYWNGLEIKILWVDEGFRGQGVGSRLLEYTENKAKALGAEIALLDTFDFQGEHFYLKNGYSPFGELDNFPKGHRRIYFSKALR